MRRPAVTSCSVRDGRIRIGALFVRTERSGGRSRCNTAFPQLIELRVARIAASDRTWRRFATLAFEALDLAADAGLRISACSLLQSGRCVRAARAGATRPRAGMIPTYRPMSYGARARAR